MSLNSLTKRRVGPAPAVTVFVVRHHKINKAITYENGNSCSNITATSLKDVYSIFSIFTGVSNIRPKARASAFNLIRFSLVFPPTNTCKKPPKKQCYLLEVMVTEGINELCVQNYK